MDGVSSCHDAGKSAEKTASQHENVGVCLILCHDAGKSAENLASWREGLRGVRGVVE